MKIEKIKNYKKIIIGGLITVGIIITLILMTSKAKYKNIQSIHLASGTITYKPYDYKIVAMYKNDGSGDVRITSMPSSGYKLNESKSFCYTTNVNVHTTGISIYTNSSGEHIINTNGTKKNKCYLYFDKKLDLVADIKSKSRGTKTSFTGVATSSDTGIYSAPDDYGTSYYFRGLETDLDNWVKFAGFYWRIIRINGNNTIRMIYQGKASGNPSSANKTGTTTQINGSTYSYNVFNTDNGYAGYMIGIESKLIASTSTSYNQAHTNTYDSNAKKKVDSWYKTNIADKGFSSYIDTNTGFCNDREAASGHLKFSGEGYGAYDTIYKPSDRVYMSNMVATKTTVTPTLQCANKSRDLFTVSSANLGNKKLTYPIGLITMDETIYAGGFRKNDLNKKYYLYTNQTYWTMTPSHYSDNRIAVFYVGDSGTVFQYAVYESYGLRPVINLKSSTKFTGSGSESDPYVVV